MTQAPYELLPTPGGVVARIHARGSAVLASPTINRGTAFTLAERETLGLTGLLPTGVVHPGMPTPPRLRAVPGTGQRPAEMGVPGEPSGPQRGAVLSACSANTSPRCCPSSTPPPSVWRSNGSARNSAAPAVCTCPSTTPKTWKPPSRNTGLGPDDLDLLVATDSEGILGIGDQGVGGIEISIGKLAVYTAAAGIHPRRVLPVVLDMGTDNLKLLNDDLYLGARHARIRDQRYDDLIDAYVTAVSKLFPNAMLHWEDFGATNARRILNKYADQVCTFNDDMQGTAATVMAAAFSAVRAAGSRISDQRVVIYGAGTAGLGIADMMRAQMIREGLTPQEATARFYPMGSKGLMVDDATDLLDFQQPYARRRAEVAGWASGDRGIGLAEVVSRVHPTMLIGTSTHAGAFTEVIVKDMAAHTARPIIMPLSNPTSKCEALPADLVAWTDGKVLTATGSPFGPVTYQDRTYQIAQANNALVFPGLGLGVTVAKARRISDGMIAAAADAVARMSDATRIGASLLPRWMTSAPSPREWPSRLPPRRPRKASPRQSSPT